MTTEVSPDRLRQRVDQQIESFFSQQRSAEVRLAMVDDLQARRAWRGQAAAVVVREDADHEHLTLADEVLLDADALEQPAVREVLTSHGLTVRPAAGPLTGVAVATAASPGCDLRAAVADLRTAGARASLHHLLPLAPVIKGMGGPATAEGPGTFAEYQASRTR